MWRGKKPRGCEEGSGCHSWIQRLRGPSTRGLCFDSHILSVSQEWEILEFFPAPRSLQWPLLTSCYKTWLGDFSTRKTNEENYHIQHFPRLLGIFCLTPVSHSIFPKRKFSSGEQAMSFITVFFPSCFPTHPIFSLSKSEASLHLLVYWKSCSHLQTKLILPDFIFLPFIVSGCYSVWTMLPRGLSKGENPKWHRITSRNKSGGWL